jgi:two-component system, NtrC family, sensor kinase
MLNYQPSIRNKITLGYYIIVALITGLTLFTYLELRYIERQIMVGEAVSELFDTTLEIRRFEKNYFLYEQRSDYEETVQYAHRAQEIISRNEQGFAAIITAEQLEQFRTYLTRYRQLMDRYALSGKQKPDVRNVLANRIRATGKNIITITEEMSKTERRSLQVILNNSQRILIISIIFLSIAVIALGQILSRMVVKPLKQLETSMGVIAEGTFDRIRIDSRDREIVSLTIAFNKMLKQLEMHERHLIQSEKLASLGTLLSGVAHELNNPLSNISSSNQILGEEFKEAQDNAEPGSWPLDPAFAQELIAQINDQTDRARNIVRSLLDFSRDREFKKGPSSLKTIVEETIQFIRGQVPPRASIALDIPADIIIIVDKQRIQQIFLNLIKNALDVIPEDNGMISVKAEKRRAIDNIDDDATGIYNYLKYRGKCTLEQDTVDIEVHDNGPGIPADSIAKIFDPFFTTKDVGKGSGLGLFIVHEIVEEHDGCIAVDSAPGRGTTFLIRLPVKDAVKKK